MPHPTLLLLAGVVLTTVLPPLPLVVQASEGGGKWLEGERYSQAALDVQASPTNALLKLLVAGGPDHFLPWLVEQKRQSDVLRSSNPNRLNDPVFAQLTGDPGWQRHSLANFLLLWAPTLDNKFLEVVRDKSFREAVRKWNSSPAPTPTNEFASAKEFVDQLQSQLVKKFDELARMAINFRGWISNYLPQVAQPIAGTDPTAAMYAAVLKLAARWALVEDKNEQQKAGSAAGSAPPPQSGPPQQQGWMVFMPQQPQQGGAPPQQQHG